MVSNKKTEESEATVNLMHTWIDNINHQEGIRPTKVFKSENSQTLSFENVRIDFPLRPYPAQVQMMKKIIHTLNESENALLESPTGSGKSLALLCAVLAWRENQEKKVAEELQLDYDKAVKIKSETDKGIDIKYESNEISVEMGLNTNRVVQDTHFESKRGAAEIYLGSDKVIKDVELELSKVPERIVGSTRILEEIAVNIPIEVKPVEIDMQPVISKKRVLDENDPSNWRNKFKRGSGVITIDDDSFEDFQANGMKTETKKKSIPPQLSDMEKSDSMKYQTFSKVPRIFVGSRTHKQITQLVSELKSKTRYNPRTTILGSRDQLCIHPKVSKASNKTEACTELMDKRGCHYKHKVNRILTHHTLKDTNRVWDIEDLVTLGKRVAGCPYYASRKIYEGAEVVFCPYNYIIDPVIRKILDINVKGSIIILDEAHNIEDSSRSAGSFEVDEQKLDQVQKELNQIIRNGFETEAHQNLEVVINYLTDWITSDDNVYTIQEYEAHHCNWTGVNILKKLEEGYITPFIFNEKLKPAFSKAASHAEQVRRDSEDKTEEEPEFEIQSSQAPLFYRKCLTTNSLTILQGLFMVLGFLFKEETHYEEDYQMVLTKKIERTKKFQLATGKRRKKGISGYLNPEWSFKLAFKCLNPGIIFKDMTDTTRSVILTSGTLSPLNTFASELETKFEGRLEANHVIDKSHVWVGGISQGPNKVSLKGVYTNWESFHFQDDLGEALCEIVESVPFGVLCFLPSYNTLDKLIQRWKLTKMYDRLADKKMLFSEPRGSDKADFEGTISSFYRQIDKVEHEPDNEGRDGALFFAVFRGKVSEGIDFSDNYCRAVVTIGIPYPAVKDIEVKFKKEYNDKKRSRTHNCDILTSNQWYSAQAFRAINQALGRCIRHKNDWGAIILLEDRFHSPENVNQLSKWVRNQFKMHQTFPSALIDIKGFVQRQLERTAIPVPEPIIVPIVNASEGLLNKLSVGTLVAKETSIVDVLISNPPVAGLPIVYTNPNANSEIMPLKECVTNNADANIFDVDIVNVVDEPELINPEIVTINILASNTFNDHLKAEDKPAVITPIVYGPTTNIWNECLPKTGQSSLNGLSNITPVETAPTVKPSPPLPFVDLTEGTSQKSKFTLSYPQGAIPPTKDLNADKPPTIAYLSALYPTTSSLNIPQTSHHSSSHIVSSCSANSSSPLYTSPIHSSSSFVNPVINSTSLPNYESDFSSVLSPSKRTSVNSFGTKYNPISVADEIVTSKKVVDPNDALLSTPLTSNKHLTAHARKKKYTYDDQEPQDFLFKVPELSSANTNLLRKDFFSVANNDNSRVRVTCSCCDRFLLEGPTRNIFPVTLRDLTFITKNTNMDNSNMVEILEPDRWECNVDLVGGPIDIRKWPNESSVILNTEDGICYRSIHCLCPISKSQGVIIRQSFGHRNSKYDGKVYLWLTQLRVRKTDTKDNYSHINYQPEDSMEIGSSQFSSINDMFYDL